MVTAFVWFEFTFVYDIRWRAYCMRYYTNAHQMVFLENECKNIL